MVEWATAMAGFLQAAGTDLLWRFSAWALRRGAGFGMNRRSLTMRIELEQSQISEWHGSLDANIALRFENSKTNAIVIRRFHGHLVTRRLGLLTSRVAVSELLLIDVQNNGAKVNLDTGLSIASGISSLYYLKC